MALRVAFKFSHLLLNISSSIEWNTDVVGNLIVTLFQIPYIHCIYHLFHFDIVLEVNLLNDRFVILSMIDHNMLNILHCILYMQTKSPLNQKRLLEWFCICLFVVYSIMDSIFN